MTLKNRQNLIKCRHTQSKRDGARETEQDRQSKRDRARETEQVRQSMRVGEEVGK